MIYAQNGIVVCFDNASKSKTTNNDEANNKKILLWFVNGMNSFMPLKANSSFSGTFTKEVTRATISIMTIAELNNKDKTVNNLDFVTIFASLSVINF